MVGIISLASSLVTYVLILSGCGGVWPAVGHVYVKSFHSLPSRGGEGGGVLHSLCWEIGGYFPKHHNDRGLHRQLYLAS